MDYNERQIKELQFEQKNLKGEVKAAQEDILFLTRLARQKSDAYDATEREIDLLYDQRNELKEELWKAQNTNALNSAPGWELVNRLPRTGVVSIQDLKPFHIENIVVTVKLIRLLTGAGLKESRDLFDSWKAEGKINA